MASVFAVDDTIVAIATPPGRGGLGVVRLSGPEAPRVAAAIVTRRHALEPRRATVTFARMDPANTADETSPPKNTSGPDAAASSVPRTSRRLDQVVATYFPRQHSYTGDDVVELSAHGSPVVLAGIVKAAVAAGARPARPGEFTLRAFLNGRIDLTQAEAVGDLIEAVTPLQAEAAFDQLHGTLSDAIGAIDAALFDLMARLEASVDFPDEGYHFVDPESVVTAIDAVQGRVSELLRDARRGRLIREGLQVAIVGPPNAGKSSLFNALVGTARAIVTDVAGTTRDVVTETIDLGGLRVTLADTAGLRSAGDVVEAEGVRRTEGAAAVADVVLVVGDRSRDEDQAVVRRLAERYAGRSVVVANKGDRPAAWDESGAVVVSATQGEGLEHLHARVAAALDIEGLAERPAMTNVRHVALVERAQSALARARAAARTDGQSLSEEFVLADLRDARLALEEVTGRRTPDATLTYIFERFCIGK